MKKILLSGSFLFVCSIVFGMNHSQGLRVQINQTFFEIKKASIEQALVAIMPDKKAAILIKLKPESAQKLTKISQSEIGQTALWIWNGKIISMNTINKPLDKDLTVFNFDPDEAERFVKSIKEE